MRIRKVVSSLDLGEGVVYSDIIPKLTLTDVELKGEISNRHFLPTCHVCEPTDSGDWSKAAFMPRSVVLRPPIAASIVYAAEQTLGESIVDTGPLISVNEAQKRKKEQCKDRDRLLTKLLNSSELDDINIFCPTQGSMHCGTRYSEQRNTLPGCKHTLGGNTTATNGCARSKQPKRISRSLVVRDLPDGQRMLYNYTAHCRYPEDLVCKPMVGPWFMLMLHVWMHVWPWLTPLSRRSPPTHAQLLLYYPRLRGGMNGHRDNSEKSTLLKIKNGNGAALHGGSMQGAGDDENSQIPGTNVIVWTTGDIGQNFSLHAVDGSLLTTVDRSKYVASRTWYLDWGTVSILDPTDDITMTHSALFIRDQKGHVRKAWAFRWLQSEMPFLPNGKRAM